MEIDCEERPASRCAAEMLKILSSKRDLIRDIMS